MDDSAICGTNRKHASMSIAYERGLHFRSRFETIDGEIDGDVAASAPFTFEKNCVCTFSCVSYSVSSIRL